MKIAQLLAMWEQTAAGNLTEESFSVHLPVEDAAKLRALADLYPRRPIETIITDLLGAALQEVESRLPYQRGEKIIALDEEGDPLYEDTGPTPRFLELSRLHLRNYMQRRQD